MDGFFLGPAPPGFSGLSANSSLFFDSDYFLAEHLLGSFSPDRRRTLTVSLSEYANFNYLQLAGAGKLKLLLPCGKAVISLVQRRPADLSDDLQRWREKFNLTAEEYAEVVQRGSDSASADAGTRMVLNYQIVENDNGEICRSYCKFFSFILGYVMLKLK